MSKRAAQAIIDQAGQEGRNTLSEHESKQVLPAFGIPVTPEVLVGNHSEPEKALPEIKRPLVRKGCLAGRAHKTERNLFRVDIRGIDINPVILAGASPVAVDALIVLR